MNDASATPKRRTGWPCAAGGALLLATLLAGCATGPRLLHTQVTTFNAWSTLPAVRTYVFSRTLEFQDSPDVQTYEDIVRDELALQGFTRVAEPAEASLIVTLRPVVVAAQIRVRDPWPSPLIGGDYGGFYGGYYGSYFGHGLGWYGAGGPGWYGPGLYSAGAVGGVAVDLYQRRLELDIDSRSEPGKRYYEGKVENNGDSDSLVKVMPALVRALFADFPGDNGQTRRVDVSLDDSGHFNATTRRAPP